VVIADRDLDRVEAEFGHPGERALPEAVKHPFGVARGNDDVALACPALAPAGEERASDWFAVIVHPEELGIAVRDLGPAPPPLEISGLPQPRCRVREANTMQKPGDQGEVVRSAHRFFPKRHAGEHRRAHGASLREIRRAPVG
jgi:hypothetical protein